MVVVQEGRGLFAETNKTTVFDIDSGARAVVAERTGRGVGSPTGHVLFQIGTQAFGEAEVWATPFSFDSLEVTGEKFLVAPAAREASVSDDGTLVYLEGYGGERVPVWLNRDGSRQGVAGRPVGAGASPALSPTQDRLALAGIENDNSDIWVQSLDGSGVRSRLTFQTQRDWRPVFTPDGTTICYAAASGLSGADIACKSANGSGEIETLVATELSEYPDDWSPDGGHLVYQTLNPERGDFDLWVLTRDETGVFKEPAELLVTEFSEREARFSVDGRYLAYVSDESGRYEVWVRRFPQGPKWQVTQNGGAQPRWSRDGSELFLVEQGALMAVPVQTSGDFVRGPAEELFSHESFSVMTNPRQTYDVSADGEKFLVLERSGDSARTALRIVQNWYEEFRERQQD